MKRKLETKSSLHPIIQTIITFPGFTIFLNVQCLLSLRRTCSILQKLKIHSHGYTFCIKECKEFFEYNLHYHYLINDECELNRPAYLQIDFPYHGVILPQNVEYLFLQSNEHQSVDRIINYFHREIRKNLQVLHVKNLHSNNFREEIIVLNCHTLIYDTSRISWRLVLPNLCYLLLKTSFSEIWQFFRDVDFCLQSKLHSVTIICSEESSDDGFTYESFKKVIKPVRNVKNVHYVANIPYFARLQHIFPNATIKYFVKHAYYPPCDDYTPTMNFWQQLFNLQDQRISDPIWW